MKMNATEAVRSWYGQESSLSNEMNTLLGTINFAPSLLKNLLSDVGAVRNELSMLITQSGVLGVFNEQINALINPFKDQSAILTLRNHFGEADLTIETALDTYVDLASDEMTIRSTAKKEAVLRHELMMQETQQILGIIQLFIAQRFKEIHKQKKTKQTVIFNAQKAVSEHSELGSLLQSKQPVIDTKIDSLEKEEQSLSNLWEVSRAFFGKLIHSVEDALLPVEHQSTMYSALQPVQ